MMYRTLVASSVAVLGLGLLLAPVEASARAGGFGAGRAMSFHGGIHRPAPRPFVRVSPLPRHVINGHLPAHRRAANFALQRHHHHRFFRHHHRDVGSGVVISGVSVFYGSPDDPFLPPAQIAAPGEPADTGSVVPELLPEAVQSLAAIGRNCRSTAQMVPSERGGQAEVRITRCYPTGE